MEEIISILQNPEKMEQLILKSFIDSFRLKPPPRGVHQTNILQHVFKYSNSRECFDSFRLVCKSWQYAVETIRLNTYPDPCTIFRELCLHERNGNFHPFYTKYFKIFRNLVLDLDEFDISDMLKWNSISNLLVDNMTNLRNICICFPISNSIPPEFVSFLFNLFKNSKSTLKDLVIECRDGMVTLPTISLPNLTHLSIFMLDNKVQNFDDFMKTFVDVMCPNLKIVLVYDIHQEPQILKYITKNYPNHFIYGPEISTLEHIPLKISHLNLEHLAAYRYAPHIEYLVLHVKNLHVPSEGSWDDYRETLSFFPNLKGIIFAYNETYTTLVSSLSSLPSASQNIWQERIDYFKSQNIKILDESEYLEIISKLRQSLSPSWSFSFCINDSD